MGDHFQHILHPTATRTKTVADCRPKTKCVFKKKKKKTDRPLQLPAFLRSHLSSSLPDSIRQRGRTHTNGGVSHGDGVCVCVYPPVNQASISGYLAGWLGVRRCRRGWEMTAPCFLLNTCIHIFHLSVYCLSACVCLSIGRYTITDRKSHKDTHSCAC